MDQVANWNLAKLIGALVPTLVTRMDWFVPPSFLIRPFYIICNIGSFCVRKSYNIQVISVSANGRATISIIRNISSHLWYVITSQNYKHFPRTESNIGMFAPLLSVQSSVCLVLRVEFDFAVISCTVLSVSLAYIFESNK